MDMLGEWRFVGVGGVYGEGGVARSMAIIVRECAVMLRVFRSVDVTGRIYMAGFLLLWMK